MAYIFTCSEHLAVGKPSYSGLETKGMCLVRISSKEFFKRITEETVMIWKVSSEEIYHALCRRQNSLQFCMQILVSKHTMV